jgi:phosphatidate cytidylyltransferase
MKKRVLSSVSLVAIVAGTVSLFGAIGCVFLILISGAFTQLEFYALLQKIGQKPMIKFGTICGILLMLSTLCFSGTQRKFAPSIAEFLFIAIVAIVVKVLLSHSLEKSKSSVISTIIGVVYVPFMCSFPIALFNEIGGGRTYVFTMIWMIIVAKCCDIGGMFAGKYYGRAKLAPKFSPQKTVEGFIGGVLLANLIGLILMLLLKNFLPNEFGFTHTVTLSTAMAVFSLIGDLAESAIKRLANEKDSGNVFPRHRRNTRPNRQPAICRTTWSDFF